MPERNVGTLRWEYVLRGQGAKTSGLILKRVRNTEKMLLNELVHAMQNRKQVTAGATSRNKSEIVVWANCPLRTLCQGFQSGKSGIHKNQVQSCAVCILAMSGFTEYPWVRPQKTSRSNLIQQQKCSGEMQRRIVSQSLVHESRLKISQGCSIFICP